MIQKQPVASKQQAKPVRNELKEKPRARFADTQSHWKWQGAISAMECAREAKVADVKKKGDFGAARAVVRESKPDAAEPGSGVDGSPFRVVKMGKSD